MGVGIDIYGYRKLTKMANPLQMSEGSVGLSLPENTAKIRLLCVDELTSSRPGYAPLAQWVMSP